jgi:signal transduction histidine kinase
VAEAVTAAEPVGSDLRGAPHTWTLWAIAVAGIAIITGTLVLALASSKLDRLGLRSLLVGWIAVPYLVSGILAWWRRPASRLGPLMVATGFATAISPLQWLDQPVLYSIGHLFDMLPAALFLHVFLAFPTGKLTSVAERVVVIACYAAVLGLQVVKILLGIAPASVFAVLHNADAANWVEGVQLSIVAVLLLAGAALLFIRRAREGRRPRRPTALLVDAFGLALVMLALLYVAGTLSWSAFDDIRLVALASLGLAPIVFLFALLDARLARGQVAALMVELGAHPTADLQVPLARALRDPSLSLAYWLPEYGSWADHNGRVLAAPQPDQRRALRIIFRDDEPMAALLYDRSLTDEPELLDAVAAAAGIAMENGRLQAELRARLEELRGSRVRVLEAGQRERQRLERNLHDGAQQRLVALSLELGLLGQSSDADPETRGRLARAKAEVAASLAELRDVARGIYPAVLTNHGLAVALESLAGTATVPVRLAVDLPGRLPEPVEVAGYYVVSESLANAGKHARATCASVQVSRVDDILLVEVTDDGVGGADPMAGSGLRGLSDRVEAVGGRLDISSSATGTRVKAEIPCPKPS